MKDTVCTSGTKLLKCKNTLLCVNMRMQIFESHLANLWSLQWSVPCRAPLQVLSLAGAAAVVSGGGWSIHQAL